MPADPTTGPTCPACGVPYTAHIGLAGICRILQQTLSGRDKARADLRRHAAAMTTMSRVLGCDHDPDVVAEAVAQRVADHAAMSGLVDSEQGLQVDNARLRRIIARAEAAAIDDDVVAVLDATAQVRSVVRGD